MLAYLKDNVRNLIVVDGERISEQCGSPKVLNVALLAAEPPPAALTSRSMN
jgi:indolepyruvate ferredoxin oxidoreductase beta subunit